MADTKITALTALTGADPANDVIPIVDVSDTTMAASGTTKKISVNNILGASGTATLASATITGDLTVKTNVLKVDTTNNRVGINNASPTTNLHVGSGVGLNNLGVGLSRGATTNFYEAFDGTKSFLAGTDSSQTGVKVGALSNHSMFLVCNNITQLQIDPLGVFSFTDGAGGTRMTLNSTGLGVGTSPAVLLDIQSASAVIRATSSTGTNTSFAAFANTGGAVRVGAENSAGGGLFTGSSAYSAVLGTTGAYSAHIGTSGAVRMTVDSSGNVGIGVTPSAWSAGKALEISSAGNALWSGTGYTTLMQNAVQNSGYKYGTTNPAARYDVAAGTHAWFTAPSGTAGTAITFTQAMTLDASGNLLVKKTAVGATTLGAQIQSNGSIASAMAESTDAALNLLVYSTGAAASRFYVGMGGTVFATNTTISAISDARLKENVQDIDVGLGAILALKPRKFDWKEGKGKDIKGDRGFIAQEFEQVFPNLIDEWKDAAPEGEAPYKSVRQDLIPVLVKAIQELTARVQTLETR